MISEREALAWQAVVAESARRRCRRRRLSTAALAVVVAAGSVGALNLRRQDDPSVTDVAAGPLGTDPAVGPALAGADPRAAGGGPIPSLGRLFAVPACAGADSALIAWVVGALEPYVEVDAALATDMPLAGVASSVPVLRDPPPAGACSRSVAVGQARGWELVAADGSLLGRGASVPTGTNSVPSRLTNRRALYHQERVASGQPFSGVIDGSVLDGVSAGTAVVLDVPSIPTTASDPHAKGVEILARLSFASVAPFGAAEAFRLPTTAPPGFARCTADLSYFVGSHGPVVEFCDDRGRTITLAWGNPESPPATGRPVDINGFPGRIASGAGKSVVVSVDVELGETADLHARLVGYDGADADVLADMLRSIPELDRRVVRPRSGENDLRVLATDGDRMSAALMSAGATEIVLPPTEVCPSSPPGAAAPVSTTIVVPCPIPRAITFTVPPGSAARLFTTVLSGPEPPFAGVLPMATGVETVAGIDVLLAEFGGTAAVRDSGQQAAFICGKVWFNFFGNDVFVFVRSLIPTLGC